MKANCFVANNSSSSDSSDRQSVTSLLTVEGSAIREADVGPNSPGVTGSNH